MVLFCAVWWFSRKPRPRYAVAGLFALLYGCFRFLVEFVRLPDEQIGYLAFGWFTMGQLLSLPITDAMSVADARRAAEALASACAAIVRPLATPGSAS